MGKLANILTLGLAGGNSAIDPITIAGNLTIVSIKLNYFFTEKQFRKDVEKVLGKNFENVVKDLDGILSIREVYCVVGADSSKEFCDIFTEGPELWPRRLLVAMHTKEAEQAKKMMEKGKIKSISFNVFDQALDALYRIQYETSSAYYEYLERSGAKSKIKFFPKTCSNCKQEFASSSKRDRAYEEDDDDSGLTRFDANNGCCIDCGHYQGITPEPKYFIEAWKTVRNFEATSGFKIFSSIDKK